MPGSLKPVEHRIRVRIAADRRAATDCPPHHVAQYLAHERGLFDALHEVTGKSVLELRDTFTIDLRRGEGEPDDGGLLDALASIARAGGGAA